MSDLGTVVAWHDVSEFAVQYHLKKVFFQVNDSYSMTAHCEIISIQG